MLLFFIRHGDPIYNPDSLTPLGKRQAEAIAKRLALFGVDRIFTSPAVRARETAAPTAEILKIEPEVAAWALEDDLHRDLGAIDEDGRERWLFEIPEYRRLFNSRAVRERGMNWTEEPALANAEFDRFRDGADGFLAGLGYVHDRENLCFRVERSNEERVALFAHHGVGLAFLSCVLDIPYPHFCTHFNIEHSGMSVIRFDDFDGTCYPRLLQLSCDSHLYREGLPLNYRDDALPYSHGEWLRF